MTDLEVRLGHAAPLIGEWLEGLTKKKQDEITAMHRRGEETKGKLSELVCLNDLYSNIKSKAEALGKRKTP